MRKAVTINVFFFNLEFIIFANENLHNIYAYERLEYYI